MSQTKEPNAYEQQLVTLGRVLQALREDNDVELMIAKVIDYLKGNFSFDLIWIGLYDRVDHRLFGKGGTTPTGHDLDLLKQKFSLSSGDVMEQVVMQQRPIALPDLREEMRAAEWRKLAAKHGIQGTMIFPIRHKEQCYGVMLLGSRLWGIFPGTEEKARLSIVLGSLALALNKSEIDWQRQQVKRPDQPLLKLLTDLRSLANLGQRLDAIVEETHRFINPSRTCVYWFERQNRYFWRRVSNQKRSPGLLDNNPPTSGITVQEVSSFYQALVSDQIVSIGEAHSSLKADTTGRLMQQIRARSLLAAPIWFQNELMGFLAVEGNEPRIWQEEEKNYVRGAAQLTALVAPLEEMEERVQQTKLDQSLTGEIAYSIYSQSDWKVTLKTAAELLGKRLKTERFVVLLYDPERECFDVCYQSHAKNRRALPSTLPLLRDIDWQLMERSPETITIENLEDDLRLGAWRETSLEMGLRSLMASSCAPGQPLEGIVMVCHDATRSWSRMEAELVRSVAQQIGMILRQWQLQKQNEQQQKTYQMIQWGLSTMQQTDQPEALEQSALQHITKVLQVPLAVLVSWAPGKRTGKLIVPGTVEPRFTFNPLIKVSVFTDTLIHWALEQEGVLPLAIDHIPVETRQWLNAPAIGQLLVMAVRTAPDHEPTGVIIVADGLERRWADRHLNALATLVNQFAWSRRYLMLAQTLQEQRQELEQLGWYKQRRLEDMYRVVKMGVQRLGEISTPTKDALSATRQQQILRQIGDAVAPMQSMLRDESWQIQIKQETVSLVSLLRRALERVDGLIKQRQLWSQVHNEGNPIVKGDIAKLELVFYEVLLTACQRSQPGGRIDLWCRPLEGRLIEVSITDDGEIEPRLLEDFAAGRAVDLLAPSMLDKPPGLHLAICKSLMHQMGAGFNLYKLEDGRVLSRLVMHLAPGSSE
jgi:GAF domain-containing protein